MSEISIANKKCLDDINKIRLAISSDEKSCHSLNEIDEHEIEYTAESITLVSRHKSVLIGYLKFHKINLFLKTDDVILEMFVHPEFQGQGADTGLIEACIDYVTEKKYAKRIILSVLNCNIGAIKLYEGFGFVVFLEEGKGKYMYREVQH